MDLRYFTYHSICSSKITVDIQKVQIEAVNETRPWAKVFDAKLCIISCYLSPRKCVILASFFYVLQFRNQISEK